MWCDMKWPNVTCCVVIDNPILGWNMRDKGDQGWAVLKDILNLQGVGCWWGGDLLGQKTQEVRDGAPELNRGAGGERICLHSDSPWRTDGNVLIAHQIVKWDLNKLLTNSLSTVLSAWKIHKATNIYSVYQLKSNTARIKSIFENFF